MRSLVLWLPVFILCLVASVCGLSPALALDVDVMLDSEPLTWEDADGAHLGWVALDEVALVPGTEARLAANEAELRIKALAMSNVIEVTRGSSQAVFARMAVPDASAREGFGPRRKSNISPVVYTAPSKGKGLPMALTGMLTVSFASEEAIDAASGLLDSLDLTEDERLGRDGLNVRFRAVDPYSAFTAANELNDSGMVKLAAPEWVRGRESRLIPDDPRFAEQWNLRNTGQSNGLYGFDLNVVDVWDSYRGSKDEVIAVVDEDLDLGHEDLVENIVSGLSWDFVDGDDDPTTLTRSHGTKVAGMAAARGNNALGVSGVAPEAGLAGFRLPLGSGQTDLQEAQALSREGQVVDIYNNSWGPTDAYNFLVGPGILTWDVLQQGVADGRGGLGNIYIWAAGNGGTQDNVNFDGYANNRYVIAVGAADYRGERPSFGEPGASIRVCAPSGTLGLASTAPDDAYTNTFSGTSAAAPQVAGAVALILQANPDLTWREVQAVLMATTQVNDEDDEDWVQNGADYWVNHKYGFGAVDVEAAIDMAKDWTGRDARLGVEVTPATASVVVNQAIPDMDADGVSSSLTISDDFLVEWVDVVLTASDHLGLSDLEVVLTSPSGTESVLAKIEEGDVEGVAINQWRFGTVRNFMERSAGTWTLTIRDQGEVDEGTFESWSLTVYGAESAPTSLHPAQSTGGDTPPVTTIPSGGGGGGGCVLLHGADITWSFALLGLLALALRLRARRR